MQMPDTIVSTPAVSGTSGTGPLWSGNSVTLDVGQQSRVRNRDVGTAFDALHDGCSITNIKVEITSSKNTALASGSRVVAAFAGVQVDIANITTSPTNYSANGGSGTLPSTLRSGGSNTTGTDYAVNNDGFYPITVTSTGYTITVTYNDNGLPGLIQFSF